MRILHWVLLFFAALEVCLVVLVTSSAHAAWPWTKVAGTALLLFTIVWVGVARYQLGRAFSVAPQARHLVTTGLYRRIRNPIYVASPLLLLGMALLLSAWWPLTLLAIIVPVQIVRARREAAVLQAAFGDAYNRYRAQTWF